MMAVELGLGTMALGAVVLEGLAVAVGCWTLSRWVRRLVRQEVTALRGGLQAATREELHASTGALDRRLARDEDEGAKRLAALAAQMVRLEAAVKTQEQRHNHVTDAIAQTALAAEQTFGKRVAVLERHHATSLKRVARKVGRRR